MNRIAALVFASLVLFLGLSFGGCSKSRKHYYATSSEAPVVTYTIVFVDTFGKDDRQEIISSISAIFSALLADHEGNTVINNTYNSNISITIDRINGGVHIRGDSILASCGDDNECPDLYQGLCHQIYGDNSVESENRGRQVSEDNRHKNKDK